jgi:Flp pilus assembly protein TadD
VRNAAKKGATSTTAAPAHNEAVPTRVLLRAALAAVCVVGATLSAISYSSYAGLKDAFAKYGPSRDFAHGLGAFRASDSPLAPSVYRDEAIAIMLLHTGRAAEAERVMVRSARGAPADAHPWVSLARIQVARGRLAAARASYAHARVLNPHVPPALPPPF